ncbi:MAG: ABC transporter permease [Deltaproteobacteria bacterium]|nr:ABC transporter permease [Deltaproteobacteria bacterium]
MARRLTAAITMAGVALVVFVFAAVLMMAHGIRQTLSGTGSEENVLVIRKAATGEIASILSREVANIIKFMPQVARAADGKVIASTEAVIIINLEKIDSSGISNIAVRGVSREVFELRPQVRIVEGRTFTRGAREIIVGRSVSERFKGAQIGQAVRFGGTFWTVVGLFETRGSGFDSEAWGDVDQILDAFRRSSFSTVTFRLSNPEDFDSFVAAFQQDNRLQQFDVKKEKQFFEEQSELMATFIRVLGLFITAIFSLGATIGATITMYAAVANRTVEIGMLRALGFARRAILAAFLAESFLLSLSGGLLGLFLASFLRFFTVSTLNFGSFSELAFSFALSPSIIISSIVFAILMGLLGGFSPAVRAARLNIVSALRAP